MTGIGKDFPRAEGGTVQVLRDITLTVERGTFFTLLGPSGCGKSTLLNILAGFEEPTMGKAFLDDQPISGPGTDRTVIFQDVSNALFPWMNAHENVEFGPKMGRVEPAERKRSADKYLELVGLAEDHGKFPSSSPAG